jgi:DNA-binding transcriptional ArsR family regulator
LTKRDWSVIFISLFGEMIYMKLRELMSVNKALGDENRVRMLLALKEGELCVCQITELFGLSASTTSKHLSILYQAGLLDSRKEGRWIYYQLPAKGASDVVTQAIDWVTQALAGDSTIAEDAKRLKAILKEDPKDLCKQQCQK